MIIHFHKLFMGRFAEARSYQLKECLKKKQDLIFIRTTDDDEPIAKMTIPYKKIKYSIVQESELFKSKINPEQKYRIISFKWNPDKPKTEDEELKEFSEQCL